MNESFISCNALDINLNGDYVYCPVLLKKTAITSVIEVDDSSCTVTLNAVDRYTIDKSLEWVKSEIC